MVDKELIERYRKTVKPVVASWLLNINHEGMGEQDKEEFERDFDEILDLALIGLKYKAQLSQEGTTPSTADAISRQTAIDAVDAIGHIATLPDGDEVIRKSAVKYILSMLPPAQPEERTKKRTETHTCDCISRKDAIRWIKTECNPYGKPTLDFESGKRVMKHLEQMPPAQPEPKWIPCSETVDVPDHEVMACDRYGEFIIGYLDCKDEQWLCESDDSLMYNPVAWCELPKPYKEGGADVR